MRTIGWAFLAVVILVFIGFVVKVKADPVVGNQFIAPKVEAPVLPPVVLQPDLDARITVQIPAWAWVQPTFTPINQWTTYDPKWTVVPQAKVKVKPSKKFDEK